jgi:uncharacterized protein (TIRG00374 family)
MQFLIIRVLGGADARSLLLWGLSGRYWRSIRSFGERRPNYGAACRMEWACEDSGVRFWLIMLWAAALLVTVGATSYLVHRVVTSDVEYLPDLWKTISPFDALVAIAAMFVFYSFDYLRLFTLLKLLQVRLPLWRGLEVIVVSEFASVLTPTAELHMPAAVYVLSLMNVPTEKATAAITTKTMYGIMWVCIFALTMLYGVGGIQLPAIVSNNLTFLLIPIFAITIVFILLTIFAQHIHAWTQKYQACPKTGGIKKRVISWAGKSAGAISMIGTSTRPTHLLCHAANLGFIATYCFIGWWLARSMNVQLSLLQSLTIFSASLMVDYISPVPGSIGVCEFATAFMIDPHLSPQSLVIAILLRILCKYLVLIPGSLVVVNVLRRQGTKFLRREAGN